MISTDKKFLFIHIPKTGGNSVQERLQNYSDDQIVSATEFQDGKERFEVRNAKDTSLQKHASLSRYRQAFGDEILDYYIFSTIRNPWDKIVSYYFSPHRGRTAFSPEDFERFAETVPPIERFLSKDFPRKIHRKNLISRISRRIPKLSRMAEKLRQPQTGFTTDHVSRLMRFEHLSSDFAEVCVELGLHCEPLIVRNKSDRPPYRECYTRALAKRVAEKHGAEIALGGYTF